MRYLKRLAYANRDVVALFFFAFAVRLMFAALVADTYDYDEFVILLLGRDFAHGAIPYTDFAFFHPPGVLVLYRLLAPITNWWWPTARIGTALIDSLTAALVVLAARRVHGGRAGLAAGIVYALSPLALISSVRVGQDPLITLLGTAGLTILLVAKSQRAALLAGACAGIAIWIKYPAALLLPIYLVASPRRGASILAGAVLLLAVCFGPFLWHARALYNDTIVFQRSRWAMPLGQRLETTLLYWLVVNLLAVCALFRYRQPGWLVFGFLVGGLFVFTPQVYYHYFVATLPLAAIIAAPLAARLMSRSLKPVVGLLLLVALGWGVLLDVGGASPLYVTAAHLSDIEPTVLAIDRVTRPDGGVLADRFEYAYLAQRPASLHYFWNIGVLVGPRYLETRLGAASVVVLSYGASSGYPMGFTSYLQRRYPSIRTGVNRIWLLDGYRWK